MAESGDEIREAGSRSDSVSIVQRLRRRNREKRRRLSMLGDEMIDDDALLEELERQLLARAENQAGRTRKRGLPAKARAYVFRFQWIPGENGGGECFVDGTRLELSPVLAHLLRFLAADTGRTQDAFVGWKPNEQTRQWLNKETGMERSAHAVAELVGRLKKKLVGAGYGRSLIQTHANRRSRRLALVRPARMAPRSDS